MPLLSAVMVFHRVTPFFRPAIASVLSQTLADLELVLVDNGCGPSAAEALGALAVDPRVRWVRLPQNLGIPGGHNAGIAAAQGEFVMLLDYDDVALPRRAEKQVAALRADARLGLVSCCAESIDESGAVVGREFSLLRSEEQYQYTHYTTPVVTPAYTGRRELFARFPYRAEFPFAADYDFLARAAEVCALGGVPEVLLQYRHHAQQTTVRGWSSQILSACVIRLLTARRRSGRPEDFSALIAAVGPWWENPPMPAEIYARFADWSLRERCPRLAVYHARKAIGARRRVGPAWRGISVVMKALRQTPGDAACLLRLFLTGPVRTHQLRPA